MAGSVHYVHLGNQVLDIGPHVFPIEKYALLARALRKELRISEDRFHAPESLGRSDLARVHGAAYLDDLEHARVTPATALSELPVERSIIDGFVAIGGRDADGRSARIGARDRLPPRRGLPSCVRRPRREASAT